MANVQLFQDRDLSPCSYQNGVWMSKNSVDCMDNLYSLKRANGSIPNK